jgi:alcohol dehydrogenase (cytochrome c)
MRTWWRSPEDRRAKQKVAEWKEGYSLTVAPLIANGVLITGCSGAEFGARCFLDGWDPATGKKLWRRYTTAGPGEKGYETWEPRETYMRGGASTWITGSYDPELDLVYWGTGNAGPWNGDKRKGDNLYAASVLAVRPKTGEIVWHYQFAPNDIWDWDSWEMIQAEIPVDGQKRKVVMHVARNGFLYVLDRANGKLLSAKPYEKVNWATHVDLATGRPVESEESKKLRAGQAVELWPSPNGAKNWGHAAFNPNTGLLYANTYHSSSTYKFIPMGEYKAGQRYQFIENVYPETSKDAPAGHMEAIDPMTAKATWRTPLVGQRNASAMLATGGGLIFTGKNTGEFIALDADTGEVVWSFRPARHQRAAGDVDQERQAACDHPSAWAGSSRRAPAQHHPALAARWTFARSIVLVAVLGSARRTRLRPRTPAVSKSR